MVSERNRHLVLTTFPSRSEFERAKAFLQKMKVNFRIIEPTAPLSRVAVPALVVDSLVQEMLLSQKSDLVYCGWIEYRPTEHIMPDGPEPGDDLEPFGIAVMVLLQPCVADETKIRFVAHLSGNLEPIFPHMNAILPSACYNPDSQTLTYMKGYRMICLSPQRIAVAKADDIVDGWLTLEDIRRLTAEVWTGRNLIKPCYETRRKPPALEIFKRLPGTNCGQCGEKTCMAFAVRLWAGEASLRLCRPVFEPGRERMRAALIEICAGLGIETG